MQMLLNSSDCILLANFWRAKGTILNTMKRSVLFMTLVHLGLALCVQVEIEYSEPLLKLLLPGYMTPDVGRVSFRYTTIGSVQLHGNGVLISEGWQYQKSDLASDGIDEITAFAVIYDTKGNLMAVTDTSNLKLAKQRAIQLPPSRRIRAVIFRDDFNTFNAATWNTEVSMYGGGNAEFQMYTNDIKNVYVRDGHLYLRPIATTSDPRFDEHFLHAGHLDMKTTFGDCTQTSNNGCTRTGGYEILPPVMSGKVRSVPTLKFGTVEVRARIPRGDWLWPAIWMVPKGGVYGGWPRSGEIDIMESKGNAGDVGVGTVTSTLIWAPAMDQIRWGQTHAAKHNANWHTNFHTWRMDWTHDHIVTYIDNQQILSVTPPAGGFWQQGAFTGNNLWASGTKMAPFDQEFYIIFNVAVGSSHGYFVDGNHYGNVTKPWQNHSPHPMLDFWNAHNAWLPTWQGENSALVIDWVEFRSL